MRMKYIIGNWKMFPKTKEEAQVIVRKATKLASAAKRTKIIVCPPMPYLGLFSGRRGKLCIGAQNASFEDEGARTGETSPAMLASLGISYVILGHSERRAMGETDAEVAKKVTLAVKYGLTVILCVGEQVRAEDARYFRDVEQQLTASLAGFPKSKSKQLIIAYEPVWAIGKNAVRPATPKDTEEMVILIRKTLVKFFGRSAGFRVPVLYGGSVDEKNFGSYIREGRADGLLVGRASIDPERFSVIARDADKE
jgi:triosephosphate isomerase